MIERIETRYAPQAIGPYSQAVKIGNLIFTSGQIALTPDGSEKVLKMDVAHQTLQVCRNLQKVLEASGASLKSVVKTTIYLTDINDFGIVNKVYEKFFSHKPARSTVAVKELPKGAKVEIECIAVVE
ncbi:MAG: Rid family detoxifying hydrolase [Campylobacterales bacterium]